MPEPPAETLVNRIASDSLPERYAAVACLRESADGALPALVSALDSPVARVRKTVSRLLGEIGDERAGSRLAELLEDRVSSIRRASAIALAAIPNLEAAPRLRSLLRHRSPRLRRAARHALGRIGPAAWPEVGRAADSDDWRARESAVHAARALGGPRAVELLERLAADPHGRVRATARWAGRRMRRTRRRAAPRA